MQRLSELFPGIAHIRQFGLQRAGDPVIWHYARQEGLNIVTADGDFLELLKTLGSPPKVVFLERCDYPARIIEELLRRNAVRIAELENNAQDNLLVIRP